MYRAFTYLYYRIYAWNLRTWGDSDVPQFNALFGVSALILLNMMSVFTAIDVCVGRHVVPLTRPVVIGLGLGFLATGYFLLVHNGKYRRIAKGFSNETPTQRKRRFLACVVYAALSFVSFFWLVQLRNS
jgi:pimeloyl-ACP methyl ester carboxylesterase